MSDKQYAEVWSRGRLLMTDKTKRWSPQERAKTEEIERRMIFANFSGEDEGRSRIPVCTMIEHYDWEDRAELIASAPKLKADNEALRAENKRLREALKDLLIPAVDFDGTVYVCIACGHHDGSGQEVHVDGCPVPAAREALTKEASND